ncbi:MAG: CBS domain-containing protein [Anaerolineales bacterium]|nr:CBS domain-containing protein [Anaerolineales bacterium]
MISVKQLLSKKGHDVWSISPQAPVFDALMLMAEKDIGALMVLEEDNLVGIISERDYARKVILKGKSSMETQVKEIMSSEVISIQPDQTIENCMELMTNHRIRHLPVYDGNRLTGVISIGDVVKAIITQQEFLIDQMEQYITGRR